MHFQTQILLLGGFIFLNEKQLIEYVRFQNIVIELLYKKLALFVQRLDHGDYKIDVLRIIVAMLVFTILAFSFDDLHYCFFDKGKVYLLDEVFLISVKLGVKCKLA